MPSSTVYRCGGYRFSITGDAPLIGPLRATLVDLADVGEADHRWQYRSVDTRHHSVAVDDDVIADKVPTLSLVSHTVASLTRIALDREPARLHLHAMAVVDNGAAVVAAGPSGSGKSTLCSALIAAGADYISDETVAIDPETGRIGGFPKPLIVKSRAISTVAGFAGLEPANLAAPVWAVAASSIGSVATDGQHRVGTVASYRFALHTRPTVEPLHRATLVRELLTDSPDAIRFGPNSLPLLARFVASSRSVRATGDDARAVAEPLLAHHRSPFVGGVARPLPPSPSPRRGPSRAAHTTSVVLDGRSLVLEPESNRVLELDETAGTWWQLLDGTPLDDVVDEVSEATGATTADVRATATRFVDEFVALRLLDIA